MTASSQAHRVASYEDWLLVSKALDRLVANGSGKRIHGIACAATAWQHLYDGHAECWLVGGYLVVFAAASPWYSDRTVLHELLVVRVGPGGTLRGVVQFLRQQAQQAGASLIAVGTAFAKSDRALSRLYQAEGFKPEATTLTMEL